MTAPAAATARAPTLYTPEILSAATSLARFAWDDALALKGTARSPTCGSSIEMGLACDEAGRISRIGLRPHACAVGQAAASVFAGAAAGRTREEIERHRQAIAAWLASEEADAPLPEWPGLALLERARAFPARHGAILLAWDAALAALALASPAE